MVRRKRRIRHRAGEMSGVAESVWGSVVRRAWQNAHGEAGARRAEERLRKKRMRGEDEQYIMNVKYQRI